MSESDSSKLFKKFPPWTKEISFLIIGAMIGFFGSIGFYSCERSIQKRDAVQLIAVDVLWNLRLLHRDLSYHPEKSAVEYLKNRSWFLCENHNFFIYETFVDKISLLHPTITKQVYEFYLELKTIDDKCNFLSENREKFTAVPADEISYYYENHYQAIKTGYTIINNLEIGYGIDISNFEDYFQRIKEKYDLIIKTDPEMKNKIPAPPSVEK